MIRDGTARQTRFGLLGADRSTLHGSPRGIDNGAANAARDLLRGRAQTYKGGEYDTNQASESRHWLLSLPPGIYSALGRARISPVRA